MHDQNAATVVTRLWIKCITRQGCPLNILSDQGDNVDGDTIREICDKFTKKKQRTSGYHREGNGFAERNICTIRELFRSLLLDFEVPQNQWNEILPGIIFALNTSISSVTKCTPYKVLYWKTSNITNRYNFRNKFKFHKHVYSTRISQRFGNPIKGHTFKS